MDFRQAMTVAVLVILAIPLVVATAFLLQMAEEPQSECGNGLMEASETPQNCCEDTGCLPSQSCTNHSCTAISCRYCEYAANNSCHRYECCSDAECGKNETCSRNTNKCVQIECECGYIKNKLCLSYECCSNQGCKSGLCINHMCAALEESSQQIRDDESKESETEQTQQQSPPQQSQQQQCIPSPEVCDSKDNNCNGLVDDSIICECSPDQTRSCGYNNVGLCKLGTQTCQTNHIWGTCTGQTEPSAEACDDKDNDCDGQTDEGNLCPEWQLCTNGNCKTVNTDYKVLPVIFYPADYANDQEMTNYLKGKFEEIRQFYLTKAGTTFTMLQPQVVSGDHSHEWYWCVDGQQGCVKNNFEASIIDELKSKGFPVEPDWNKFPSNRVTWVAAFGGGGFAGGRSYPTGGGFSMVGDAGIYAAKDNNCDRILDKYFSTDNPPNAKDSCKSSWVPSGKAEGFGIGALGHELGHTFKLPHPDFYPGTTAQDWEKTLMGYHWNYPNTGLLEQDKEILQQSPYINTKS